MRKKGTFISAFLLILLIGLLIFLINNKALSAPVFYVANAGDGTISKINLENSDPVTSIELDTEQLSHGIAISPDETIIYFGTGFQGKSLHAFNVETNEVINELNFNDGIHGIDIHPSGKYLYVSLMAGLGQEGGFISVIDTTSFAEVAQVITDNGPAHISVTTDGSEIWVTNVNANSVSVIDAYTYQILATIPVGEVPNEVAVSPNFDYAFSANVNSNSLTVIDMFSYEVVKEIVVGEGVHGVTVAPDGKTVWTANNHSNDVSVVDIESLSVITTIDTGSYANHISFSPDGSIAFVTHRDSNSLAVINTKTYKVVKDLKLGKEPHEMTLKGMEINDQTTEENEVWDMKIKMRYFKKAEASSDGVNVNARLLSPYNEESLLFLVSNVNGDPFHYFSFAIDMSTHSGDLLSVPFEERIILSNNDGQELKPKYWKVVNSDSHHPQFLAIFEKTVQNTPLLKDQDTKLTLQFKPFVGEKDLIFQLK